MENIYRCSFGVNQVRLPRVPGASRGEVASRAVLGQRNGGQRNGSVETTWFGNGSVETTWFGNGSVETTWFGLEGGRPREPRRGGFACGFGGRMYESLLGEAFGVWGRGRTTSLKGSRGRSPR